MATQNIHEVSLHDPVPEEGIPASEMRPGQYAEILDNDNYNAGRIVGRIWSGSSGSSNSDYKQRFFAIDNPKSTWSDLRAQVRILRPGEIIHITVGEVDE